MKRTTNTNLNKEINNSNGTPVHFGVEKQRIEFLENVKNSILAVQLLAEKTFSTLADQLATDGVAKAVVSAASTHATLGGNLATAADGVARAIVSAASTHATLGGNLATSATAIPSTAIVQEQYVGYFRTLILTMLGELPRKGHLLSDFDEMFYVNYEKTISQTEFHEIGSLMHQVKDDWVSDAFLTESPSVIQRLRSNLLKIAAMLDITERIPSNFTEDDLKIVPHINLLNDFLDQLLMAMGVKVPTYKSGINNNPGILEAAKKIVSSHRNEELPFDYKILRTALLENTAQARIKGLKIIANNYDLGNHPYLTTHDIVEEYHGRDSLEELRIFVYSSDTSVQVLEKHLSQIVGEISEFYSSMEQCTQAERFGPSFE